MKKILVSTALGLVLAATAAQAQSYGSANNAKSHDSTLGSAQYMQPKTAPQVAAAPAPAPTPAPAPVAAAEPAPAPAPAPVVDTAETNSKFHGLYIGGEANYTKGSGSVKGWGGDGLIGYGFTPHVTTENGITPYLGLELSFGWSRADSDSESFKRAANASLRPGVILGKDLLVYGIAGYSRGDVKSKLDNDDTWLNGWDLGAGLELASLANLPVSLRLEYTYTDYQNADLGGVSINPHDNAIKLGVLYHFH